MLRSQTIAAVRNRTALKYFAAAMMLLDHIGMMFVPADLPAGCLLRVAGRLTAPIMCFFLAEGYAHTASKKQYGIRLLVFAVISQFAYAFAHSNRLLTPDFNMIFTLFLGFLILLVYEKIKPSAGKWALILLLTALSYFCDWGILAPLWILAFFCFRGDRSRQAFCYCILAAVHVLSGILFCLQNGFSWYSELWQLGVFLFVPILFFYNGENGPNSAFSKWFFYFFYPLHLALLGIIAKITQ